MSVLEPILCLIYTFDLLTTPGILITTFAVDTAFLESKQNATELEKLYKTTSTKFKNGKKIGL